MSTSTSLGRLAILSTLPPDVIRYLLNWMGPKRTALLSGTCKELHKMCSQDMVWKQFFLSAFGSQQTERIANSLPDWEKSSSGKSFWKAHYSEAKKSFFLRSKTVSREAALKATQYNYNGGVLEVRIGVFGAVGVGKSATTVQFFQSIFVERYDQCIEDSYRKMIEYSDGKQHMLEVLDTAPLDDDNMFRNQWMSQCEGVIVIFDVTRRETLDEAEKLLANVFETMWKKSPATHPMILVANKIDVSDLQRVVTTAQGEELARKYSVPYFEISAKLKKNIDEVFELMTVLIGAYRVLRSPRKENKKEKEKCIIM